jgi:TPR repeat protein
MTVINDLGNHRCNKYVYLLIILKPYMQKFLLTTLAVFISILSFGQNAEELNQKSKDLLAKQDFKNALPLLKQAAENGSAEAQYNYGVCYQQGIEVPKNDSIANNWFLQSAKRGWKDAQFKIAYSYAKGRGWLKDDKKAFYWSVKCAEQQDPECMFNVVNCYLEGYGTEKNIDSMLVWASRLALLHNPEDLKLSGQITSARANLAIIYSEGKYVPKNFKKSYMWFLIYNENKNDFSILVQQGNIEKIKDLEKKLTVADKANAISEAENLLTHKLANLDNLYKQDL